MGGGIDQGQLDRLYTSALEAAVALLEKRGRFLPLLFELRHAGEVQAVAVLERENRDGAQSVFERFAEILRPRAEAGIIRASAIVVHRPERQAVELRIRAPNYAANIFAPYAIETMGVLRRARKLSLGEPRAESAPNEVFG